MKYINVLISFLIVFSAFSQFKSGFDSKEALDMIQICNSFGYLDLYEDDSEILPSGYTKVYTSPAYGMDNKFQVYTNGNKGVINFRGSTTKQSSWLENLYASMIPIEDKIVVNGKDFNYKVGEGKKSKIHAGYMLAIYFFKDDLLKQIKALNKKDIYDIYITGHSQGGALAQLVNAYLDYLPSKELDKRTHFKVYAFANPMIGNKEFANEYSEKYCNPGMSYIIHNPSDFVPRLPVSYNDSTFWKDNLVDFLQNGENFNISKAVLEGALLLFRDKINDLAKNMSKNIESQLLKELGEIQMPTFQDDINYVHTGNLVEIFPTEYPLELKDSTILKNDSLMKIYKRDKDGVFIDKKVYKKPSMTLQHKAYNYYTALLKEYYPKEYKKLKQKYFVMPKDK